MNNNTILNRGLTKLQKEVHMAIKYQDDLKLKDIGGDRIDVNFLIEIEQGVFYPPIILATVYGFAEGLKILLSNPMIDIEAIDQKTGCNSFWFGAYYDRGECMTLLAQKGINIYNQHKETKSNALHVAIER